VNAAGNRSPKVDQEWVTRLGSEHRERAGRMQQSMAAAPPGDDGRIHPNRLLSALQERLTPDAIVIADGGDLLSFARVGLSTGAYLDPGPFGCIGVGVPFGVAASLAFPDRLVAVVTGDGSFGFNGIEVDTAVRHKAPLLIVVANNGAWQIEVHDQTVTHGRIVGTKLQFPDYAAMARAFGMYGERVERTEDLAGALARALDNRPALVDVVVTPEAVSADAKSGLAWVPDLQPLAAWDAAERAWRGQ
jgi:acetolactate synthase-1/2/3 large subunit